MRIFRSFVAGSLGALVAVCLVSFFIYGTLNLSFVFGATLGSLIGSALMAGFLYIKHRRTRQVLEGN